MSKKYKHTKELNDKQSPSTGSCTAFYGKSLFSNFIDGLVIQRNNGTISDENREILEKAENAIIKSMNESVVSYIASKIDDTFYDALAKERGAN